MLVSHSPPVFSHSPPAPSSFLSDYGLSFARTPCRSPFVTMAPGSPRRPCLVVPAESSPTRLKKRVVFADDRGMSLTHVRVMSEPSNVPPLWSCRFLAEVTRGVSAEPEARAEPWELTFAQPASDYVDFRKRLERAKVSLENIIVKEAEEVVVGTVKVSNLAFGKEVVVRASSDNWASFEDAICNFVPQGVSGAYVLYDTFSFKIPLNPKGVKMELCVCYRCDGEEFWDNNGGQNYVLLKRTQGLKTSEEHRGKTILVQTKVQDSWSEFASWTHLENTTPYW